MLGVRNTSMKIEFDIYDIIEKYVIDRNFDLYEMQAEADVLSYFGARPNVPFKLCASEWQNTEGETCFISWIKNGNLNSICFDCKKSI